MMHSIIISLVFLLLCSDVSKYILFAEHKTKWHALKLFIADKCEQKITQDENF